MQCERCSADIAEGDDRQYQGQTICEDCYMVKLSPAKACEPWAVFTAQSFAKHQEFESQLTARQQQILETLRKDGPSEPGAISKRLQISDADLEREIATLRHMEKLRGELKDGKRMIRIFDPKDA